MRPEAVLPKLQRRTARGLLRFTGMLGVPVLLALLIVTTAPGHARAQDATNNHICSSAFTATIGSVGISVSAPADQPVCQEDQSQLYGGQATSAKIDGLVVVQQGGHPCSYQMSFDEPLSSFAFERAYLKAGPSGITHPIWSATAYDASGRLLGTTGENEIRSFSDVPEQTFTLRGPGITRVVFWGDDKGFDGFCNVVIDGLDPER